MMGKKDLEPRPGNYSRPTPIPHVPQAHTYCTHAAGFLPWGRGGGGAESLRVCPPISVPSAVHRANSFEISSRPTSMHQQHASASNHHIILDSTLCAARWVGETRPTTATPFPIHPPTYFPHSQCTAMYAHPLTSENTRRPRHLLGAGRRARERRRPAADGQHRQG